ncbi:peptidase inhibitor family I36 protein [Kitasatospora sp. NPDC004723]|uniref:peptidase inhibitor family I36 protein n=1 Tax=Kitasatospora sp. NPDC004723 TaxID=3154288 RepID=UPI0033AE5F17
MNRTIRRSLAVGLSVAALSLTGLAAAGSASAAGKDGGLAPGEFGLFYNQNQAGYIFDLADSDVNFSNDVFPGTSVGANDNTESYWNRDTRRWDVYTDADGKGIQGWLPAGQSGNASANFKNQISSAYWR